MVKRIIYCDTCEREVELTRRNINPKYNELFCFLTLFTVGIGYVLVKYSKKKDSCPYCDTRFDLNNPNIKIVKKSSK